jgi:hypothetical protein
VESSDVDCVPSGEGLPIGVGEIVGEHAQRLTLQYIDARPR